MTIQEYLNKITTLHQTGNAREHSYRGDLQNLLMSILPDVLVTNEPARVECGAPDYVLTRKDVPIGYIEAKDIGVDLKDKKLKEQFDRYKSGLSNLIITDYLEFQFFKDGNSVTKISIAKLENGIIIPLPENFKEFTDLIINFSQTISQSIKSPTRLAQMMAGKARLMADIIEKSLNNDDKLDRRSNIKSQMLSFKQMLIHDIDNKAFSDIYAQTIAYGMFAARYHDPTLEDFSRTEAAQLIPKSNPFLRKLFQDIAGFDLDDRLVWIVDELVSIFLASDVAEIMKNFGKSTKQEDPVVHFYETFLGEYSPALRKARGVWYTPQPVVSFIVRSVDEILKTEFNLSQGLADTSKIKIKKKAYTKATADSRSKLKEVEVEEEVHKVQILDPATGTGTFLAEVVKHIYGKFKGQQGIWSNYVKKDLIPRLNGFELLMASYAMAHLKMDMLLTETGVQLSDEQRLRIYLTNSLEEAHPDTGTLFSSWLSDEADQANIIKRETPVMVIMGNPPYSGESSNKGDWIMSLMEDYKKEPGGKVKLKERNPKWINDDYVKFLRYGQHFIEKNGSGVLAFINPHGFLDNPTFRGMRWSLLKTYDKIYTLDLHGNSKKEETAPDGGLDVNVFDIMQGVSINIFVKNGNKKEKELANVFHYDLFGKREFKYDFLNHNSIKTINYLKLPNKAPNYFMVQKDFEAEEVYLSFIKIDNLFVENVTGFQTHRDDFATALSKKELLNRLNDFANLELDSEVILRKYNLRQTKEWIIDLKRKQLDILNLEVNILKCSYRPFEERYVTIDKAINDRPRTEIIKNYVNGKNISLLMSKQQSLLGFRHVLVSSYIASDCTISSKSREGNQIFPLYIYPEINRQQTIEESIERIPNLNIEIVNQIAEKLVLTFSNEKQDNENTFAPIDILDYIYAVLHSPTYRETYKEFLKIDFPRVPVPQDHVVFWKLVKLGGELRQIHLLEHSTVENYITQYPKDGDNFVTRKMTKNSIGYEPTSSTHGKVWINDDQYFDNVPLVAWEFYIGGYQPAQKWLKDRYGRELNFEDILHYQKIIVALTETDRLMNEIDKVK
ncbi:type ISP restriction/modification enzyme [Yeosuana marina]|uniref:type ISP restriction/modification enzyme n=1 Tax=Yeosuana marina TaxID=1565536 RepID=UPI0030ED5E17|tara:strand:+ start:1948 stop:5151 length:3204 start_codon:yes stop_codon:yes gene_type:complete